MPDHEKVSIRLCECVSNIIDLPNQLEIEFISLPYNVYGGTHIEYKFKNRFKINENLSVKEIVRPVVHELLHINQIHLGRLKVMRDGTYIWDNIQYRNVNPNSLSYQDYMNLPWEQDVNNRLENVLFQAIQKVDK